MEKITGTTFCRVEHQGQNIASAAAAGYWLTCECPTAYAISSMRRNILDSTRAIADMLGYDLVLRHPATVEEAA